MQSHVNHLFSSGSVFLLFCGIRLVFFGVIGFDRRGFDLCIFILSTCNPCGRFCFCSCPTHLNLIFVVSAQLFVILVISFGFTVYPLWGVHSWLLCCILYVSVWLRACVCSPRALHVILAAMSACYFEKNKSFSFLTCEPRLICVYFGFHPIPKHDTLFIKSILVHVYRNST